MFIIFCLSPGQFDDVVVLLLDDSEVGKLSLQSSTILGIVAFVCVVCIWSSHCRSRRATFSILSLGIGMQPGSRRRLMVHSTTNTEASITT